MSNHKNCFELVKEVRYGLNEYDDALASGDDNIGAFKNQYIIGQINISIRELYSLIARRRPDEFMAEASLTAVNSVITLPSNFSKLVLLRDQYGSKITSIDQVQRRSPSDQGSTMVYYKTGRTLVIDRQSDSSVYTLIYKTKPRDIHQGKASAGAATSITLSAVEQVAKSIIDFYNGMTIEDITAGWDSVISDYTAARVATVTGTAAAGDFYALVPEIPEWSHHLIAPRAILFCKLNPISKEKPTKAELEDYKELFLAAFRENATPEEDIDYEEMFFRAEPKSYGILI
jgi:hypothetical protein